MPGSLPSPTSTGSGRAAGGGIPSASAGAETRARVGSASAKRRKRSSSTSSAISECSTGRSMSVEPLLCGLEAVADDRLDRVRRPGYDLADVLVGAERCEHVVGDRAAVAAARAADADPQPLEVLRPERLRERA